MKEATAKYPQVFLPDSRTDTNSGFSLLLADPQEEWSLRRLPSPVSSFGRGRLHELNKLRRACTQVLALLTASPQPLDLFEHAWSHGFNGCARVRQGELASSLRLICGHRTPSTRTDGRLSAGEDDAGVQARAARVAYCPRAGWAILGRSDC